MTKLQRILIIIVVILVVFFAFFRLLVVFLMQDIPELGVKDGLFLPCPAKIACISSQIDPSDEEHGVEKIPNAMPIEGALGTMKIIMRSFSNVTLVQEERQYLRYEVRIPPFGFVDDLEFYFPCDRCYVEVRSSSRIEFPDFNKNRDRVDMITERFTRY
ncbi:MAG: DUF1499 domain-containing protein [Anaerolineae bacterium]|jgi:uncharacterized protein (DUF1499 family)|nr:DUF1499 domain-containing protein [Anaerolineae bacterium]